MTEKLKKPEELIPALLEANANLVIASVKAQELRDEAEAANYRQKEFLSMLAHELRNPLAPIALAADMLERIAHVHPQLPSIQQIITRQVAHMKRLLEDLLDGSRVATGKIQLIPAPLLLSEVLSNAADIARPAFDSRHQQLVMNVPGKPIVIHGDAVRLAQVFSNLLLNASKYTPRPDPITVSVRVNSRNQVEVSVKDQGIGIEPAIQPYIFDLFMQAPRPLDRSDGGLGIGLSIVRTLVKLHGGTVKVLSDGEDKGSEFIVTLPISAELLPLAPKMHSQAYADQVCRILIVEDNIDGNRTLNICLSAEGHKVDSAFNGKQGLAMAVDGQYDIIFCDIGLPGMDGYEVVRQVKAQCAGLAPYCVAMTGYDQSNYRKRAQQAGFDKFLVKPVAIDQLLDIVTAITHIGNSKIQ